MIPHAPACPLRTNIVMVVLCVCGQFVRTYPGVFNPHLHDIIFSSPQTKLFVLAMFALYVQLAFVATATGHGT